MAPNKNGKGKTKGDKKKKEEKGLHYLFLISISKIIMKFYLINELMLN